MQPQPPNNCGNREKGKAERTRGGLPVLVEVKEVRVLITVKGDCNYSAEDDNPGDALFKEGIRKNKYLIKTGVL